MTHWAEIVGSMLRDHWVWGGLTLGVLLWYMTVTVYVTVKGVGNIRSMLKALDERVGPGNNGSSTADEQQRRTEEDEP